MSSSIIDFLKPVDIHAGLPHPFITFCFSKERNSGQCLTSEPKHFYVVCSLMFINRLWCNELLSTLSNNILITQRRYYFIVSYFIFSHFDLLISELSFIRNHSLDHIQWHAIVQFTRVKEQVLNFFTFAAKPNLQINNLAKMYFKTSKGPLIPKPGSSKVRTVVFSERKFLVFGLFVLRAPNQLFGLFGVLLGP